jgi:hypothetical protein
MDSTDFKIEGTWDLIYPEQTKGKGFASAPSTMCSKVNFERLHKMP